MPSVFDAIEVFNREQATTPAKVKPERLSENSPTPKIEKPKTSVNRDTTVSRYHDTATADVRKAVKLFGKEAATYRFSLEEKRAMQAIVYDFRQQGINTSESQIVRIALNLALEEHKARGAKSVLDQLIREINE